MSENYEAKAAMILDGSADLLDDGKVVLVGAKRFNEDFWGAYSKQIAKPISELHHTGLTLKGQCPECKFAMSTPDWNVGKSLFCTNCGQKVIFLEVRQHGEE